MDAFLKNKYLFWAVIILILLNLVLISTIIFGFMRKPPELFDRPFPPQRFERDNPFIDFISHELNFDNKQRESFLNLTKEHFKSVSSIFDSISEKRKNLIELTFKNDDIQEELTKRTDEIGKLNAELEKIKVQHFRDISKICSAEQKEKLKELSKEIMGKKPPLPFEHRHNGPEGSFPDRNMR